MTEIDGVSREPLAVELARVELQRDGRKVLTAIDWRIEPGQRWLVFGANGAGKSQLLKLIAGSVWPTPTPRGRVRYLLGDEWHDTPHDVMDEIAYVGPERQDKYERYGWNMTVAAVVATGHFRTDIALHAPDETTRRVVARVLTRFGISHFARRRFLTLSYGQRRLVLLARALASRPRLLLLDELFGGLDAQVRERLRAWLETTARGRLPWVLAAHRSADIPRSITHALVLDRGRIVYRGPMSDAPRAWFSRGAKPTRTARPSAVRRTRHRNGVLVKLSRAAVHLDYVRILRDVDLEVRRGECWIVHGGNGSGKTTLLRALYGDHAIAVGGAVHRDGIEPGVPLQMFKLRTGLVAPHLQSDHALHLRVAEVVQSGLRASIGLGEPPSRSERTAADAAMREFGVLAMAGRSLRELSYGQMRRVLFARAHVMHPALLLLDEPFAGLDPRTRADLRNRIDRLVHRGTAVVMSSHHRDEWPHSATHELELVRGKPIYTGVLRLE